MTKIKLQRLKNIKIDFNLDPWHLLIFVLLVFLMFFSASTIPDEPDLYAVNDDGYYPYISPSTSFNSFLMIFAVLSLVFQIGYLFGKRSESKNQKSL